MALVNSVQNAEKRFKEPVGNFEFRGWYADEACTKKYDFNSPDSDNIVYIKWTEQVTELNPSRMFFEEHVRGHVAAVAAGAAAAATAVAALLLKRR